MIKAFPYWLLLILILVIVSGCKSVDNDSNTDLGSTTLLPDYDGPAATSADAERFQKNVWDNLRDSDRCGNCHGLTGPQQSPLFARDDDVNLAYQAALSIVDTTTPANSLLVTKVTSGHNCWLSITSACGDVLTAYIEAWLNPNDPQPGNNEIVLVEPTLREPADGKRFPDDTALFSTTVWPVLTEYCATCHSDEADFPQAPYLAQSDVNVAYEAVRSGQRIDLDDPSNSRLVVRLQEEFHNCWSDCQQDADEMLVAITQLANGIVATPLDSQLVHSKALSLYDGIVASGGSRFDDYLIARYEFKSGSGDTLFDTSGIEPALNLTIDGVEGEDYQWVGGWGLELTSASARGSSSTSSKLAQRLSASDAYTIEAWLVPANVTQEGPARIISYSANTLSRNFTFGQTLYNYNFAQRSSSTDVNGLPMLSSADADEVLQATQQHVAMTYSSLEGRKIYVNGELVAAEQETVGDNLNDWDENYTLLFGAEADGSSPWQGKFRMVAIHEQALSAERIQQNMGAGVGERYFLLFNISDFVDVEKSYMLLEVSQFDSYSYLFHTPRYVNLSETANDLIDFPIKGLRIGINGAESAVGQVYRNLDGQVTANYQTLSTLGTIISLQQGAEFDEFFLTFEQLGSNTNVVLEPVPAQPAMPADSEPQPRIGLRTYGEINATMSRLTDIATTQSSVQTTYETVVQQLPTDSRIDGFLSSHQVAISQLAIEYCNALVEDTTLRSSYFPGFDFGAAANLAFDTTAKRDLLLDPLINRINGDTLLSQPDPVEVKQELNNLIDRLTSCGTACSSDRTLTVAKSSCTALLSSAVMVVQ